MGECFNLSVKIETVTKSWSLPTRQQSMKGPHSQDKGWTPCSPVFPGTIHHRTCPCISYSKHERHTLSLSLLCAFGLLYGNWVWRMCFYPSHSLFWCLKSCMAEAAAADGAAEDQRLWGMGCLGQRATTFLSSPQWRWVQKGRVTAARQLGSQVSR